MTRTRIRSRLRVSCTARGSANRRRPSPNRRRGAVGLRAGRALIAAEAPRTQSTGPDREIERYRIGPGREIEDHKAGPDREIGGHKAGRDQGTGGHKADRGQGTGNCRGDRGPGRGARRAGRGRRVFRLRGMREILGKSNRGERSRSRERSWERRDEKKRPEYRESSYERDMRGRERVRTVADLPWERGKPFRHQYEDYYKPPPIMRDVTRKPVIIPDVPVMPVHPPENDDDGEVNVVDVLRLLTALEERLGSLGPKVIDLLAQALALEKKEANGSETLLDSDINCVLFETAKEKLKGQLLAGLVDVVQERAFKKAIKKIATLLHMASQRKRQRERLLPKASPVTVPGVGAVDKAAIAKQIATALIMQGKTDVTQQELEQLINAVVGMAEASKNSNRPMTTATFLQQLSDGTASMNSDGKHKESEEKIIIPTQCKKPEVVELEKLTEPLTPSPGKGSAGNMENLSDSDLQTLLQNFKDLSTDEQHNLINYLKKLEAHEPERVERLRKFVNLESSLKIKDEEGEDSKEAKPKLGKESPFSNRLSSVNPTVEEPEQVVSDDENNEEKQQKKPDEKEKPAKIDSEGTRTIRSRTW
ncbi:hypothetical protein NQ318_022362 [Aromia moschata]|uniref:Uncharacterized protein n=1 Tax=Aromia moschata TaxID=1265417 RepID=A0AAV8Z5T4_9CUCU|nr:hypothetical protein NQ318_022362 [Aromia moschata]